jgi:hypothetical protein
MGCHPLAFMCAPCWSPARPQLVPNAIRWFTGEALDDDDDEDEEDGDDDDEDDDDDDEDDDEDDDDEEGMCMCALLRVCSPGPGACTAWRSVLHPPLLARHVCAPCVYVSADEPKKGKGKGKGKKPADDDDDDDEGEDVAAIRDALAAAAVGGKGKKGGKKGGKDAAAAPGVTGTETPQDCKPQ